MSKFKISSKENDIVSLNYEIGGISNNYNKKTAEALSIMEKVDRYDDFSVLKIPLINYKQTPQTFPYGIEYTPFHEKLQIKGVILPHQKTAAEKFLKELRGFGLLADTVGSGKTFEAGLILSELASRGKISSTLFVVPKQTLAAWKEVMEEKFGMGKDTIYVASHNPSLINDKSIELSNGIISVNRNVIVATEDFVRWNENAIKHLLFHAIVVDEAHHLSEEKGEYAKALKLLSYFMIIKKQQKVPYCLLLSATPHSGNLEKMFRLWYFIRCKGGVPQDYDEKLDMNRTDEYRKEKNYYKNVICRGATTVAEYISIYKKLILEPEDNYSRDIPKKYEEYINSIIFNEEVSKICWENYNIYNNDEKKYSKLNDIDKSNLRDLFLQNNQKEKELVLNEINSYYHKSVMGSIMIRQKNNTNVEKNVENYYFLPTTSTKTELNFKKNKVDYKVNYDNLEKIYMNIEGQFVEKTMLEYCNSIDNIANKQMIASEFLIGDVCRDLNAFNNKEIFTKDKSHTYYGQQFQKSLSIPCDSNRLIIVKNYKSKNDILTAKIKKLDELLSTRFKDERVILFFDYSNKNKVKQEWDIVNEYLQSKEIYKDRILFADKNVDKHQVELDFKSDKRFNAILIAADASFTEGINLQTSKIIINFQITSDPLSMDQRIGRVFRLGQKDDVTIVSFAAMNELEGYSLAYYNRIGLISEVNGDATIISGSNNDKMIAIQCPNCQKVALMTKEEYNDPLNVKSTLCNNTFKGCKNIKMEEINVYEFKCDNASCDAVLRRDDNNDGYKCFSSYSEHRMKLYHDASIKNRKYGCSKLCVMKNCNKFRELGDSCMIMKKFNSYKRLQISDCIVICSTCKAEGKNNCTPDCSFEGNINTLDQINSCMRCSESRCTPKPFKIDFNSDWESKCPKCSGNLIPNKAQTFNMYIQKLYEFEDGGVSFCENFLKEAEKTDHVKAILSINE